MWNVSGSMLVSVDEHLVGFIRDEMEYHASARGIRLW